MPNYSSLQWQQIQNANNYGRGAGEYNPYAGGYTGSTSTYGGTGGRSVSSPLEATLANIAAQQAANQARIPNAPALEGQSSKMIEDQLLGRVPGDVTDLLGQSAAERGIATGMPGSGNMNAAYLRALGLTSIGQQESGQRNLSAAYARNPGAPIMNAENMVITPLQQAQLDLARYQAETGRIGATKSGGGGGGGGYMPRTTETGTGGYIPASTLFGSGGRGTIYTTPNQFSGVPSYTGADDSRALEGYYPTSGGSLYMGGAGGYEGPKPGLTDQEWEELLGNYGD